MIQNTNIEQSQFVLFGLSLKDFQYFRILTEHIIFVIFVEFNPLPPENPQKSLLVNNLEQRSRIQSFDAL